MGLRFHIYSIIFSLAGIQFVFASDSMNSESANTGTAEMLNAELQSLKVISDTLKDTGETSVSVTETSVSVTETGESPEPYHWYLKTNLPAWALLIANIHAEMDVTEHMSVMLPIYYSGWNYFKSDLKFRIFAVLPELRYWIKPENQGLFVGAHFGMAYYNYAKGGDWRYQDHKKRTPALGGGVTLGYRLPIRSTSPWQFEFSVGCGVYHLDYDIFVNKHNGMQAGRRSRTFFGLDNAAVTLSYRFDQTRVRKGSKR